MIEDIKIGDYLAIEDSYQHLIWVKVSKLGKEYLIGDNLNFSSREEITLVLDRIKILYNKKFAYDRFNNRIDVGDKIQWYGKTFKAKGFYAGKIVVDRNGEEESIDLDYIRAIKD